MSVGITKSWTPIGPDALRRIPAAAGVFELADADGRSLMLGYAGGHSTFGLRSEVTIAASQVESAASFRVEVTSNYMSRLRELYLARAQEMGHRRH